VSGVLGPRDLAPGGAQGPVRVAGRARASATGALFLADAVRAVGLEMAPGETAPKRGELVVVRARWTGAALVETEVLERHGGNEPGASAGEHSRLLDGGVGPRLELRARGLRTIRAWFDREGFVEVDTPQLVPSPGLDLHLDAFACEAEGRFLVTSPEHQMKRLVAGGMARIYQLGHCFRRDELGPWHEPELTLLEWYRGFAGMDEVMHDTEQLVAQVAAELTGSATAHVRGRAIDLAGPFLRVSVAEAFERHAGVRRDEALAWAESDEDRYFRVFVESVEPALAALDRPVLLVDLPASQASLARLRGGDPRVCERFELLVGGVELCNGFGELVDAREQQTRFERDVARRQAAGKPVYPIDPRFLAALREGMPRSGGNALGVDRLLAVVAGCDGIADAMPFPRAWLG
jgi:lysyl-tRNA synthetase class 2